MSSPAKAARPLRLLGRTLIILLTFLPVLWLVTRRLLWATLGSAPPHLAALDARAARRLREACERLGVIFVKLGQLLGVRADFLPAPYVAQLARLQDSVTPVAFHQVKPTLEREFGLPLNLAFDAFDETPLATASIGQVHRARYAGRDVVVKFLRPDTRELLTLDLRLLRLWAGLGRRIDPRRQWKLIDDILDAIEAGFFEEANFAAERDHAERLREQLAGLPGVYVPYTVPARCTANVLTLEFCSGVRIANVAQIRAWGIDTDALLNRLVELYARMMLLDGYYHADPHPGNFLVQPDGTLVLLDFGLVRELSERTRRTLYDAARAALSGDIGRVVECLYASGMLPPDAPRAEAERFVAAFARLSVAFNHDTRGRVTALEDLLRGSPNLKFIIPPDLLYAFRLVQMLEGVASNFRPGWNVVADGGQGLTAAFAAFVLDGPPDGVASPFDRFVDTLRFGFGAAARTLADRLGILVRVLAR
ncbi:MAG: AarF/UbiB family protein [Chloracidobacterium sp.]